MAAPFTPTITVQAGFGYSPLDDIITWTDLTTTYNPRDLDIQRGRSDELARFSPGTCQLELVDTTARNLDPTNLSGVFVETVNTELYAVADTITVTTEVGTSLGTDNAISNPSSVAVGDLLIAYVGIDDPGATGLSTGTGSATWTELFDTADSTGPNTIRHACYARIATGSDALVLTGDTDDYCVAVFRVVRHGCTTTADIAVGTSANAATGAVDPPTLTPGAGSKKWLWLALMTVDETIGSGITASPSGYTSITLREDGNDRVGIGVAYKQAEASSDNPGTFTTSPTTRTWLANTIAVPPLASTEDVTQVVPGTPLRVVASVSAAAELLNDPATGPGVHSAWRVDTGAITGSISGSYPLPTGLVMTGPAFNFDTDASFQFGTSSDGASPNHDVRIVLANGGYIGWNLTGTTLTYAVFDGGSTLDDVVTWNDTNHRYLRIRFSGNDVIWERSADASSWTTIDTYTRGSEFSSTVDWSYGYLYVANNGTTTPSLDDFIVKCSRFTLFTGAVEAWDYHPLGGNQGALVDVDAVDAFSKLANIELRAPWVYAMEALAPTAWWRLAETDGTVAHDNSGHGWHATIPEATVALAQQPILDKIGPRATRFFRTQDPAIAIPAGARMSQLPHSVNLWVQASQPFSQLGLSTAGNTGGMAFITHESLESDGNSFHIGLTSIVDSTVAANPIVTGWRVTVVDLISTGAVIADYPATIEDALPHMLTWIMSVSGTTALYIDGAYVDPVATYAGYAGYPLGTYIGKGSTAYGTNAGFSFIGLMQEVAFFDGYHVNATDIADLYSAARAPWEGDTTGARIHRILDLIGWPAELRRIDSGQTTLGAADVEGETALAHLQMCEQTEGGRLFIGPHGEVVFHDALRCSTRDTDPVLYDDAASGVNILGAGFQISNDTSFLFTKASVSSPAGQQQYADDTAAARYGTREWTGSTAARTGQEAYLRAVGVVERYKTPVPRVGSWTVTPEKTPADWPTVLWQRLGDSARLQFQLLDTGDSYDDYVDVAQVSHRIADGAWTIELLGTPQDPRIGTFLEWDASTGGWDSAAVWR